MRTYWQAWLGMVVCAMLCCCGAPALLYLSSTQVHAQIPDPGEPQVIGWFCPQCGGLVPTGQRTCGCGFSLDGQGGGGTTTGTTGGGQTWGGGRAKPPAPQPAPPTVSAEERRQRDIYAREKQALLDAFKLPGTETRPEPAAVDAMGIPDAFTAPFLTAHLQQASGLGEAEWAHARACQAEVDALTRVRPFSDKNAVRLNNLVTERNTLWAKATSAPGLTAEERERLRLCLFTVPAPANGSALAVTAAELATLRKTPPVTPAPAAGKVHPVAQAMLQQTSVDYSTALVELAGEEWAGEVLGEAAGDRFGTVLGLAKVGVAAVQGDPEEGLVALADVLVGLIPFPQATGAVTGGRAYANVAFQAMNDFMTKSMLVVGGTADTEAFWKELDGELSVSQLAFRKWIGFGQ
ncbi:MAG: hypothetical protein ACYC6A_06430 [Armatimonadota bacterium]